MFVKVMGTHRDEEGNIIEVSQELIQADCLKKVVKWNGDSGTEICFEWYDEKLNVNRQWIYDCGKTYVRDMLFEEYEKQLCGGAKKWKR